MKRLLALFLSVFVVFSGLCACKSDSAVKTMVVTSSETDLGTAKPNEFSTDPEALLGHWRPTYYSHDNEKYCDYLKDFGSDATFVFYPDNSCLFRHSDDEEYVYTYIVSDEQPGAMNFYDPETGDAAPFVVGFGVVQSDEGETLILSIYDSEEIEFTYIMLKRFNER